MVTTTRLRLDRIASSTRNAKLATDVIVGNEIVAREGYVLAVRILEDKSTYERPFLFPTGISYVLVNGQVTIDHEMHTGAHAGMAQEVAAERQRPA